MTDRDGGKHLLIVESPAKARTLERYLGDDFVVEASVGHVLDLPKSGLNVDVEHGFEPGYVVIRGKGPILKKLRQEAKRARDVYLATDPDREGEAIAYHIARQLGYDPEKNAERFRRVTFNELTREAVLDAVRNPGTIDQRRVDAQQARRILDRLVGYGLSPLLWKKISPVDSGTRKPLSAGRVQSVAVRLAVERERQRRAFRIARYWDLRALLSAHGRQFPADLVAVGDRRLPTGKDFDEKTGALAAGREALLLDEADAEALCERLADAEFRVSTVTERESKRSPYPPFTTSSLQQESNRKLNLPARETMRIAQRLYEAGHITYMRTDSVQLSEQAIEASRRRVRDLYGDEFLSPKPRRFRTRTRGAQEAHEAIRPAGTGMRTAEELGLHGPEKALYELIWKRTLASQMAEARQRHLTVLIEADDATFRATGKFLEFAGFFRAYVEGSDDPDVALEDREILLPPLEEGETVRCASLEPAEHATKPPPRYTEATLVKELEQAGVGRPSTYASILATIVERGYVTREGKQLVPTFTAFAITALLEEHFSDLVDIGFTSEMESELDEIATGSIEWRDFLAGFYQGRDGFEARLKEREERIDPREASTLRLADLEPAIRIGRYGPYLELERGEETYTASLPEGIAPADLTNDEAVSLLKKKADGPTVLGVDPETGSEVYLMTGRYGPYVQVGEQEDGDEKPRRASLPRGLEPEAVTIDVALKLLSLPRELGPHPESGEAVRAGIGRYGPYVVHDGEYRSLTEEDDVLTVTLDRALALLAQPKKGRRRTAVKPVRELGRHPADDEPVRVFEGRYGPYVKHGTINASLPKGLSIPEVTLEQAVELIEARRARGAGGRGRKGRSGRRGRKRGS
ncbi:MAG: type I DNA topoisomerase [Gemmatimonadota bacterium]